MIEIPVGYPLLLCYQNDTISSNLFILHQPDKLLRGPPLQTPAQVCRQKIAVMVIPVGIVVGKLQDRLLTVFVLDKGFVRLNKCESKIGRASCRDRWESSLAAGNFRKGAETRTQR